MVFLDEQGGVLFASRALARLLGQEPEAMEGQMLDEWLAAPLASQWPDMTAQPERELDFLVAGQRDTLNARALPINLGGQHAYALTLGTEPPQDDNRMAALENALKSLSRQAIIEDGQLLGELSRLGGEFRSLADDLIRQQDDEPLRRALVDTMRLTLETWQQSTGKGKIVLAEKSKLWRVYMDRSSPQTRTLDKYLNLRHPAQGTALEDGGGQRRVRAQALRPERGAAPESAPEHPAPSPARQPQGMSLQPAATLL